MARILIVEDDLAIAELERDYLEMAGFETEIITRGDEAMIAIEHQHYDLILLDLMLPGVHGHDICQQIRDKVSVPIVMVTALAQTADTIEGLSIGADDYIAKPFDPAELVARVKSHLKRYERFVQLEGSEALVSDDVMVVGKLKLMKQAWKVYKGEQELKLTKREFEVLLFLIQRPNEVVSKEAIFESIWGYDYMADGATVMVHINRIRDKIEDDPTQPALIETVWGAGYRFNA